MNIASNQSLPVSELSFSRLPLTPAMLTNLEQLGYTQMTPIQAASLPLALAGQDLIAQAKTSSGKTAAATYQPSATCHMAFKACSHCRLKAKAAVQSAMLCIARISGAANCSARDARCSTKPPAAINAAQYLSLIHI